MNVIISYGIAAEAVGEVKAAVDADGELLVGNGGTEFGFGFNQAKPKGVNPASDQGWVKVREAD